MLNVPEIHSVFPWTIVPSTRLIRVTKIKNSSVLEYIFSMCFKMFGPKSFSYILSPSYCHHKMHFLFTLFMIDLFHLELGMFLTTAIWALLEVDSIIIVEIFFNNTQIYIFYT